MNRFTPAAARGRVVVCRHPVGRGGVVVIAGGSDQEIVGVARVHVPFARLHRSVALHRHTTVSATLFVISRENRHTLGGAREADRLLLRPVRSVTRDVAVLVDSIKVDLVQVVVHGELASDSLGREAEPKLVVVPLVVDSGADVTNT